MDFKKVILSFIFVITVILSFFFFYQYNTDIKESLYSMYTYFSFGESYANAINIQQLVNKVEKNYGEEIDRYSEQFQLPSEYLKSLIVLECSGHRPASSRFEHHVYNKLLDLRSGKIENYGIIEQSDITDATDEALLNLASSWGPFQLMGYKCIQLGINISQMRGENAIYWGIKWIDMTYGTYLRKNEYENAFHIHNTGREYPVDGNVSTSNPDYVKRGLQYMKYF